MTNAFALPRLLPTSDRDKDTETLALRHQITVLERQLGDVRPRFSPGDRAFLAALPHRLPDATLRRLRLLVRPERYCGGTGISSPAATRPDPDPSVPADHGPSAPSGSWFRSWHENPARGYRRIHGELLVLGITVAASTVWQILKDAGTDPAPERTPTTRATFLRSRTDALPACDFFETHTLNGTRLHVLAVIEHTGRRIRVPGATAHPTASWVTQAVGNLVMDLEDAGSPARFPIRDRDGTFPALFDAVLADADIQVVLNGVRIPRMNAIMERRLRSCRHELLDRTLIRNQRHLLHALREHEHFYNTHRPHQGIANARPLRTLPPAVTDQAALTQLDIRRRQRLGGILNEYHHAS
ncbi:integrase core domain-containing protein [Saccharothrix yanglingensis]|uniref:integrase core domain-containing protein n=1 Tax=Saccharothrix yanglingensis TaxID=659496 RepID=UPI0027D2D3C6|nr:integrase core domain-containing protein [Saccharothrix yanglingensis]